MDMLGGQGLGRGLRGARAHRVEAPQPGSEPGHDPDAHWSGKALRLDWAPQTHRGKGHIDPKPRCERVQGLRGGGQGP